MRMQCFGPLVAVVSLVPMGIKSTLPPRAGPLVIIMMLMMPVMRLMMRLMIARALSLLSGRWYSAGPICLPQAMFDAKLTDQLSPCGRHHSHNVGFPFSHVSSITSAASLRRAAVQTLVLLFVAPLMTVALTRMKNG